MDEGTTYAFEGRKEFGKCTRIILDKFLLENSTEFVFSKGFKAYLIKHLINNLELINRLIRNALDAVNTAFCTYLRQGNCRENGMVKKKGILTSLDVRIPFFDYLKNIVQTYITNNGII
ncbi:hypothetical protein J2Y03_004612 [Neobacillus niacini]|nr:hypothetical protein [Neobacillus niacini]